ALSLFAGAFSIGSAGHIPRVVMTGIVFGTVAAAVHVLARSVIVAGLPGLVPLEVRWWMLVGAVGLASVAGFWLVQTAYARGPAETVLAGLTVIDPIVAVIIGAAFFGEYTGLTAAATAGLLASAAVGAGGVWMLSRFHPTVLASRAPTGEASVSITEASAASETLPQGTRSCTPPPQPRPSLLRPVRPGPETRTLRRCHVQQSLRRPVDPGGPDCGTTWAVTPSWSRPVWSSPPSRCRRW